MFGFFFFLTPAHVIFSQTSFGNLHRYNITKMRLITTDVSPTSYGMNLEVLVLQFCYCDSETTAYFFFLFSPLVKTLMKSYFSHSKNMES